MIIQFVKFITAAMSVIFAIIFSLQSVGIVIAIASRLASPVFDSVFSPTSPIRTPRITDTLACLALLPLTMAAAWFFGIWIPQRLFRPTNLHPKVLARLKQK